LFLDHVTFAVSDVDDTVDRMTRELAVTFGPPTHTIPGVSGRVARLGQGFIEVMTVTETERAHLSPFGRNLDRYLTERGGGIFSATLCTDDLTEFQQRIPEGVPHCGPIETWVPQPNGSKVHFSSLFFGRYHQMPWVIQYRGTAPSTDHPLRLRHITINVADVRSSAGSYAAAYGLPELADRSAPGVAELALANGSIRLTEAAPEGLSGVTLADESGSVEIAVSAGTTAYARQPAPNA